MRLWRSQYSGRSKWITVSRGVNPRIGTAAGYDFAENPQTLQEPLNRSLDGAGGTALALKPLKGRSVIGDDRFDT